MPVYRFVHECRDTTGNRDRRYRERKDPRECSDRASGTGYISQRRAPRGARRVCRGRETGADNRGDCETKIFNDPKTGPLYPDRAGHGGRDRPYGDRAEKAGLTYKPAREIAMGGRGVIPLPPLLLFFRRGSPPHPCAGPTGGYPPPPQVPAGPCHHNFRKPPESTSHAGDSTRNTGFGHAEKEPVRGHGGEGGDPPTPPLSFF